MSSTLQTKSYDCTHTGEMFNNISPFKTLNIHYVSHDSFKILLLEGWCRATALHSFAKVSSGSSSLPLF